ncbi:type II toxin-antitoxin system HicB family antitoxin [Mesorhizobium sp. CA18]|uniref:type II toxin-antitoxin system HicB family antitoxin n=1 Tax=unclassified Mesorhizobium TaxID=325217 RepID=UPI001CCB4DEF|nr:MULTISPECIES: type II toxin-antitoxin system HicB family antitoxin [unclassified Mesorhizobium]MBZ9734933.1 type II toxin-antitoxin system HicB family antitoxin [Mesorhizobium sp. CA9]MBZ9828746.1 type II toxin-antitoxin system HicB family antitoxin [Mesorhizobium sp. CA18]MBZ9834459.1 type II toxin-antitoxin system HicB family antitoxin [Mesorhizobium sp. CA2]MBZ9838798.1 type II toxin-antitoxin system HicB family antitoxin [Mesorhizobium sp. CA3]MBZ9877759.1 type II toxin-antitoxin system
MQQYLGLIHQEGASDYGVSFPDFPGLITAGATVDEARELAEEALAFHVAGMIEDGIAVPQPTSLQHIEADPDHRSQAFVLVRLKID